MIVAQISDTHIALGTPDSGQRIDDFEAAVADLNALDPAPDVIVHTGDIVHNGRADEYAEAARILSAARAPAFVLAGNKDDRANLRAVFSGRGYLAPDAPFIDYSVEDWPIRLIAVDTLNPASNKGDFCAARAAHLVEMIDREATKPIAVFAHHPPFEVLVGPDRINFDTLDAMERLRRALQHSGRVMALFCGHVHRATSGHVGAIPASVVQCIATTLRRGAYPAHMEGSPVYHLHRLEPGRGVTTETRIVTPLRRSDRRIRSSG